MVGKARDPSQTSRSRGGCFSPRTRCSGMRNRPVFFPIPAFPVLASYTGTFSPPGGQQAQFDQLNEYRAQREALSQAKVPGQTHIGWLWARLPSLKQSQGFLLAGPDSPALKTIWAGKGRDVSQRKSEILYQQSGSGCSQQISRTFLNAPSKYPGHSSVLPANMQDIP